MVSGGPSPEYDLAYEYDQAGNRTMKIDALNEIETSYVYDVDDGSVFRSDNNRLMLYETWDISGESSALVSTTWYVYGDDAIVYDEREGNPTWIITENEAAPGEYSATHFVYDLANRVWLMVGETWEADGADEGDCPDNYTITWGREFRYDAARARYLNRELDPEQLQEDQLVTLTETWTDYDGDSSYGDFTVEAGSPPTLTDLRSYEPGVSVKDPIDQSSGISYAHSDLIGTTRGTTDSTGAPAIGASGSPVTYTAFGERLDSDEYLRYGYAGSLGYQTHDFLQGSPHAYLQVGARYYDPTTGRFMQRDPLGIAAGTNVYQYAGGAPTVYVDPLGFLSLKPPSATGSSDTGMFDPFWTKVHWAAGFLGGCAGLSFWDILALARKYEIWEKPNWPGFRESEENQVGDLISAAIGWCDSPKWLRPAIEDWLRELNSSSQYVNRSMLPLFAGTRRVPPRTVVGVRASRTRDRAVPPWIGTYGSA